MINKKVLTQKKVEQLMLSIATMTFIIAELRSKSDYTARMELAKEISYIQNILNLPDSYYQV